MERRLGQLWILALPLLAVAVSLVFLGEVSASSPRQTTANPVPECTTELIKSADPLRVYVGDEAEVTAIISGTCPAYELPIDLVLVVDKSNSMTKGFPDSGSTPGSNTTEEPPAGGIAPFPTRDVPGPNPTHDPGVIPTGIAPVQVVTMRPPSTPTTPVRPTGSVPNPGMPVPTGTASSGDLVPRGQVEAAGTEDNIKAMQQAVSAFLQEIEPQIQAGKVRVALVQFDDRARALVTLSNTSGKVKSQMLRIRGSGNSRIDLGIQAGQRELVGATARGRTDMDHRKVMIVWSDGLVDPRHVVRLRTRDNVLVFTVAVGRNPNLSTMKKLASDQKYAFRINDQRQLVDAFNTVVPAKRQITIPAMDVIEQLAPNMNLVATSVDPVPGAMPDARTMTWHLAPPKLPYTITYRVRPMEAGSHPLTVLSKVTYTDSEKRPYELPFPEVLLDVLKPSALITNP